MFIAHPHPPCAQNTEFTIKLKQLEDELLFKLSNAEGDITEDVALIESLEESKRVATEINEKVGQRACACGWGWGWGWAHMRMRVRMHACVGVCVRACMHLGGWVVVLLIESLEVLERIATEANKV